MFPFFFFSCSIYWESDLLMFVASNNNSLIFICCRVFYCINTLRFNCSFDSWRHLVCFKNIATTNIFALFGGGCRSVTLLCWVYILEWNWWVKVSVCSLLINTDKTVFWNDCTNLYYTSNIWHFGLLWVFTNTCHCKPFYF